ASLEAIGLPAHMLKVLRGAADRAAGMVLVTGPTGSGKTSTLYALMAEMNAPDRKLMTVEDPVEIRLPGVMQVQVNEKIGLGFATVLRSMLRQDPDVLLLGEMRDGETVETGLRAAMTGHMVLSTLHTNDAASTPARLIDMGAPSYLVALSLQIVIAQRLVRRVCGQCGQQHVPEPRELGYLQQLYGPEVELDGLRKGVGCADCNGSGYSGRVGVFEMLRMDSALVATLIGGDSTAFANLARERIGEATLAHHAGRRALAGETTVSEAMRVSANAADHD
ncbi:MAG: GspE/PulE family protein, partial [Burkholderiaceae bacterium]